jgi:hypothetical protein
VSFCHELTSEKLPIETSFRAISGEKGGGDVRLFSGLIRCKNKKQALH